METLTDYRPSKDLLKLYLPARKKDDGYAFGNVKLDGLFHIEGYKSDKNFFLGAMLGEVIGVVAMLIFSGANIFFIGGMVAAIGIDLAAAFLLHLKVGEICKEKNFLKLFQLEQVYEPKKTSNLNDSIVASNKRIKKLENWGWAKLAKGLIWFVCFAKIALIVILLMGFNTWVFALSLIYISVALIHIYKTGYFLAGRDYYKLLAKEKDKYLEDTKKAHGSPGAIITNTVKQVDDTFCEINIDLRNMIISDILYSQPHIFLNSYFADNKPKEHNVLFDEKSGKLVLKTWGVIDDNTLFLLSSGGNSQNGIRENLSRALIAYLGLRMQLEKHL